MFSSIKTYLDQVALEFHSIPEERKLVLARLAQWQEESPVQPARYIFICTHNSRRSHLGQIWAPLAAMYYGLGPIDAYSGGTEATAMNPRIVSALERIGFEVTGSGGENPKYTVEWSQENSPLHCYSKVYDDPSNPKENFCAVMTCSDADENCPIVFGAALRVATTYVDPKVSDDSASEALTYDARTRQIAREMLYAFSLL